MEPAIVLISDDEEQNVHDEKQLQSVVVISDDDEVNLVEVEGLESVVVISDDDGDDLNNLNGEELKSEHNVKHNESNNHNDVEKLDISDERVDCVHQGSNDLQELSLYECKSYLRRHGLRVSGTKEECIQRFKEHERLKCGNGESLYPIASFSINCTGDACKGDTVLFEQHINKGVNIVGKRIIAGRILKESYSASSQHTFSVEVLWSKGPKILNPLSLLLLKGRNFYKFGTLRQPWENEAERLEVLAEKHCRGDAARQKWRRKKFAFNANKRATCPKASHYRPSQIEHPTQMDEQKPAKRRGTTTVKESTTAHKKKDVLLPSHKMKFKRSTKLIFRPVQIRSRKWKKNRNLNPNLDSDIHPDHIQQEASTSLHHDGTLVPFGHHRNQQWGPNHVFNQRPGYFHYNYDRHQLLTRLKSLDVRASFSIDCTGDACKGDVVLFKQNKNKRGKIVRKKRIIIGRIIEESYGASDKQHTFTVEVLWTKPKTIKLSPTSTLQVQDLDLYQFGTLRQPWEDEAKRPELLIKKHQQVLAAGQKRELTETDIASNNNQGAKRQKLSGVAHVNDCTTTSKKTRRFQMRALKRSIKKLSLQDLFQWSFPKLNRDLIPYPNLKPKAKPDSNPNSTQDTNSSPQKMCHLDMFQWSFPNLNPNTIPYPNLKPKGTPDSNLNSTQDTNSSPPKMCHLDPFQWSFPNLNPNLIPYPNLKPKGTPDSNPNSTQDTNSSPNPNPNPNPNATQDTHSSPHPNLTQATISSPNPNSTQDTNSSPHPNSTQATISSPNPYPNSNQDTNPSPNPNQNSTQETNSSPNANPIPNQSKRSIKINKRKHAKRQGLVHVKECTSIQKRKTRRVQKKKMKRATQPNLNPKSNLKPKGNLNPNPNSNRKTNLSSNLKPTSNLNPISNSKRETNPDRDAYVDDHRQEASSSSYYDRTLLPNQIPFGFSPDQSTPGLPPNQAPLGFLPNQPSLQFLPNQQHFGFYPNQQHSGFFTDQQHFGLFTDQQPFMFPPYQQPCCTFPPYQQPFTFSPNQQQAPPVARSGYAGEWIPNYAVYQPPHYSDYNMLTANQSWMYQHRR